MKLETAGDLSAEDATPQDIARAFEDESHRGEYVQLTNENFSRNRKRATGITHG